MSFGGHVITTWDQMKQKFLHKYQDYCPNKRKKRETIQDGTERG
jgi:hypothetical protein